MTQAVPDVESIEHLDFEVMCRVARIGHPEEFCQNTAVVYGEIHRVSDCKHPICNDFGNMCGNICQAHMDAFIEAAQETVDSVTGIRFGITCMGQCGSCGMPVRTVSDIIQRVVAL